MLNIRGRIRHRIFVSYSRQARPQPLLSSSLVSFIRNSIPTSTKPKISVNDSKGTPRRSRLEEGFETSRRRYRITEKLCEVSFLVYFCRRILKADEMVCDQITRVHFDLSLLRSVVQLQVSLYLRLPTIQSGLLKRWMLRRMRVKWLKQRGERRNGEYRMSSAR